MRAHAPDDRLKPAHVRTPKPLVGDFSVTLVSPRVAGGPQEAGLPPNTKFLPPLLTDSITG